MKQSEFKDSEFKDIDKHVTILGWLHLGLNIFTLFIGVLVFFILLGAGLLSGDSDAMNVLAFVGIFVLGILVIISIPGMVTGWGLLKRKSWSRLLALVIGFFSLMNVPFGTVLGVYTFWVLLANDEAGNYFLSYNKEQSTYVRQKNPAELTG